MKIIYNDKIIDKVFKEKNTMSKDEFVEALTPSLLGNAFGALGDGFGALGDGLDVVGDMIGNDDEGNEAARRVTTNPADRISTLGDGSCDWVFKPHQLRKLLKLAHIWLEQ